MYFIVPDDIATQINNALDNAYALLSKEESQLAQKERNDHYNYLANYYDQNGRLPNFSLIKKS